MRPFILCFMLWTGILSAQTTDPAPPTKDLRAEVAAALEAPMCAGLDVSAALNHFFAGVKAESAESADAAFLKAKAALKDLRPLPQTNWPKDIPASDVKTVESGPLQKAPEVLLEVVSFKVDNLQQYAVVFRAADNKPRPLIVYLHGAAFGVPVYSIPTLVEFARQGYTVAAPALRGEPLFAGLPNGQNNKYICEGNIENLLGEPRDVAGLGLALLEQPWVSGDKYALVGHSFGSGAGLLAAARSKKISCVVSYDAWLTNPFRFYWERLRGGSKYYWESWEHYTEAPIKDQLAGLMARSVVHHADRITAPTLLFVGENDGLAYHRSHEELAARLAKKKHVFQYEVIADGGHNFVLYPESQPAKVAAAIRTKWLNKHHPAGTHPSSAKPAVAE